ncbi:MAG: DUF1330 domain-containing protein [Pseudomonadota bacterium]
MTPHIDPTRAQFDAFKALPRDRPVMMLNLLRFREAAAYPDGRAATGREAYAAYGKGSGPIFARVGGEILWRGTQEAMVIGPDDKDWHLAFIARYPTAAAFLEMVTDPDYQAVTFHRTAALEDSRLIRFGELPGGAGFAG